ncbi:MAG: ribonuclease P protein component 4 [archaeon]|nr:ribonuclease P protein component 4 [archaeon]
MAKHISHKVIRALGNERVNTLLGLSEDAVRNNRDDRARRYVELARAICAKAQTEMPDGFRYCKNCLLPLVPGVDCKVRLTGHKIVMRCRDCDTVWRMPYIQEQKK